MVDPTATNKAQIVSTHSHPKVAAYFKFSHFFGVAVSTHSHPKVADQCCVICALDRKFQHTATRRWLRFDNFLAVREELVSTHSHPKVAVSLLKAISL